MTPDHVTRWRGIRPEGLALIAIGAIFAFAVTAHPSFLNLQIAGVVIMATAGLVLALHQTPLRDLTASPWR